MASVFFVYIETEPYYFYMMSTVWEKCHWSPWTHPSLHPCDFLLYVWCTQTSLDSWQHPHTLTGIMRARWEAYETNAQLYERHWFWRHPIPTSHLCCQLQVRLPPRIRAQLDGGEQWADRQEGWQNGGMELQWMTKTEAVKQEPLQVKGTICFKWHCVKYVWVVCLHETVGSMENLGQASQVDTIKTKMPKLTQHVTEVQANQKHNGFLQCTTFASDGI